MTQGLASQLLIKKMEINFQEQYSNGRNQQICSFSGTEMEVLTQM